jgi:hypothetical protein
MSQPVTQRASRRPSSTRLDLEISTTKPNNHRS